MARACEAARSSGVLLVLFRFIVFLQELLDVVEGHPDVCERFHDCEHLAAIDPYLLWHVAMVPSISPERKMAEEARSSPASGW